MTTDEILQPLLAVLKPFACDAAFAACSYETGSTVVFHENIHTVHHYPVAIGEVFTVWSQDKQAALIVALVPKAQVAMAHRAVNDAFRRGWHGDK
jgi:uncharacterized lipoprotein YajG